MAVAHVCMKPRRTTAGPDCPPPVAAWRRERLLAAGFAPRQAAELGEDLGVDLHAVLELVDRGCPAGLAGRILAPLDDRPGDRS